MNVSHVVIHMRTANIVVHQNVLNVLAAICCPRVAHVTHVRLNIVVSAPLMNVCDARTGISHRVMANHVFRVVRNMRTAVFVIQNRAHYVMMDIMRKARAVLYVRAATGLTLTVCRALIVTLVQVAVLDSI